MDALLEAFGIDWKLLIAQGLNFGILLLVLWKFLYTPVLKTLDERAKKIAQGVEDAKRAEEKLAGADAAAATVVSAADTEAAGILAAARDAAGTERAKLVKEAEARAEAIAQDADARAKETAARALRESEQEIARLAVLAAGKVLSEKK